MARALRLDIEESTESTFLKCWSYNSRWIEAIYRPAWTAVVCPCRLLHKKWTFWSSKL